MQAKAQFLDDASYAALQAGKVRVRIQFVPFDQAQHDALAEMLKNAQVQIVASSLTTGAGGPLWMDVAISAAAPVQTAAPTSAPAATGKTIN